VALAVELENNPGCSVINAAEALMERIATAFGRQAPLFTIFPDAEASWTEVLEKANEERVEFRSDIPRAEIERLVGQRVELVRPGECTAEALAGANHPLLALIPAPEEPPNTLDGMQVVAGAPLCVAVTRGELRRQAVPADPCRRTQGTPTEHWINQLH